MLPDVALLELFEFYVDELEARIEAWHTLVHVCQKWRNVVFGSPRRLRLQLFCHHRTPVRKTLDVWPDLPIVIRDSPFETWVDDVSNIVAALEHNNRILGFELVHLEKFTTTQMEAILVAMQQPFPTLTRLELRFEPNTSLIVPPSFLGGSAPCLRELRLDYFPFPGLPKLLSSATHLVTLDLLEIPHSGYISPEAMVTCLSVLTRLRRLRIKFESPRIRPDRRHPPPPTRTLLPVLTGFKFKGVSEYSEDLVARIDAPRLNSLSITLFHQLILDTPRLTQFISRTPNFEAHDKARVSFFNRSVSVALPQRNLYLKISCSQLDWQVSSIAQVCNSESSFPQALISAVGRLYIFESSRYGFLDGQDGIENSQWLELFHPFTGVKGLYIPSKLTGRIAPALQELVGERSTEVLPTLQTLFLTRNSLLDKRAQKAITQFVAARRLAGHPIAVSTWREKWF